MSLKKLDKFFARMMKDHPVVSTAGSIGLAGAGTAALVGLIRDLNTAMEERKKKEELQKEQIDPDTIVLHVRKPMGKSSEDESMNCTPEACSDPADPTICKAQESDHDSVTKVESTQDHEMPVGSHATAGLQRDLHGQFTDSGEKQASGFFTRTSQILAGTAAGAGGYYLVERIHQKLEELRLKKQIAAAQQEYLDLISGSGVKNAEAVNKLFLIGDPMFYGTEKQAGIMRSTVDLFTNQSKNITATMLASYIMAGLGAGWLTKKFLENKLDDNEPEEEPPRIKRILFKADQPAVGGKMEKDNECRTFEVEPEAALATIGIMMDCMKSSIDPESKQAADYSFLKKMTSTPEGRQWLVDVYSQATGGEGSADPNKLPNMSGLDKLTYARTLSGIKNNLTEHLDGIKGYMMKLIQHNPEEWFATLSDPRNKGLVSRSASNALSSGLSAGEFGQFAKLPGIRHIISGLGNLYFKTDAGRRKAISKLVSSGEGSQKMSMDLSSIPSFMSNASILTDKRNTDLDDKIDKILESVGVKQTKKDKDETSVVAKDKDSMEFVFKNSQQLKKIMAALKERGLVA